jgi:predicted transcriptional regulator
MIQQAHIAFRTTSDIQSRLSAVADAEHLSVSAIVRRAALKTLRQLEEEHAIVPNIHGLKSSATANKGWLVQR